MPALRPFSACFTLIILSFCLLPAAAPADDASAQGPRIDYTRPAAHQELEEYEGPSTCTDCHEEAVEEVLESSHYTWRPKLLGGGKYSKLQMTAVPINWLGVLNEKKHVPGGCGRCHIGGGPMPVDPAQATEADKEGLDCLICHATQYDMKVRFPRKVDGKWVLPQDRSLEAARTAGRTTQDTCLRRHYVPLSGYKRGADLKEDVHYVRGMSCTRCHRVKDHRFPGFGPTITRETNNRVQCVDCHDRTPHKKKVLNDHQRLDCRTCHVVEAGGIMFKDGAANGVFSEEQGIYKAVEKSGTARPAYFWHDGVSCGARPKGSIDDPGSRIQPFKKFTGIAPVDAVSGDFLWLKLGTFAKTGDVNQAVAAGAEASGRPYSGAWKPRQYDVYFQLSHGVSRKHALRCNDCHSRDGRLDFENLGYTEDRASDLRKRR